MTASPMYAEALRVSASVVELVRYELQCTAQYIPEIGTAEWHKAAADEQFTTVLAAVKPAINHLQNDVVRIEELMDPLDEETFKKVHVERLTRMCKRTYAHLDALHMRLEPVETRYKELFGHAPFSPTAIQN